MPYLKYFFNFYIYSNLHVSFAAFCLVKVTLSTYNVDENNTAIFVFLATLISYNFIRYYNLKNINKNLSRWMLANKVPLFILNFVAFILLIGFTFTLRLESYLFLSPFVAATFFYVVPIGFKKTSLRNIAGLKLFLIAVSWASITVLFPVINNELVFTSTLWWLFLERILFLMAVIIPFDIRDVTFDAAALKTIPQMLGIKKAKYIGFVLLFLFLGLQFMRMSLLENSFLIALLVSLISIAFLSGASNKSKYYTIFWVEGIPIFWFLLVLLLQ